MSILFKSPNGSGGSLGSNKGYAPMDCYDFSCSSTNKKVYLKWSDPEDTIVSDSTVVEWDGTLLVRNDDHIPESYKDGDVIIDSKIRNQYSKNYFIDTNSLVVNKVYYYRLFPYSKEGKYNNSSPSSKVKCTNISTILSENTWDVISEMSESGKAQELWKIGDEINITLNGVIPVNDRDSQNFTLNNYSIPVRILAFNNHDKSDGSGKTGITFGSKFVLPNNVGFIGNSPYEDENIKYLNDNSKKVLNAIYNSITDPLLKDNIKPITIYALFDEGSGGPTRGRLLTYSNQKIYVPSQVELNITPDCYQDTKSIKFDTFNDENSRKMSTQENQTNFEEYWTRDIGRDYSEMYQWITTDKNGKRGSRRNYATGYIPFIFFCFDI